MSPELWKLTVKDSAESKMLSLDDYSHAWIALSPNSKLLAVTGYTQQQVHPTSVLLINLSDQRARKQLRPKFVDLTPDEGISDHPELTGLRFIDNEKVAFIAMYDESGKSGHDIFEMNTQTGKSERITKMHTYIERFSVNSKYKRIAVETRQFHGSNQMPEDHNSLLIVETDENKSFNVPAPQLAREPEAVH
jgi:hypothetical protein